ncbi:DNA topoisomerase 2-binding protein 1 [Halyomorpha halys]|uniref:DNA topoisomerase 2-binding protein 1 n=1 Tax=Halyomorpha halys TaxID=286706 RepID=UPI0006D4DA80
MAFMDFYENEQNLKEVVIHFVQDGVSSSKEMLQAFNVCQDAKFKPKIISDHMVPEIKLGKNIVFVMDNFSGDTFDYLASKECLVVGPSCLYTCFSNAIPIPNNNSAVFNLAMRGVVICTTNLNTEYKAEIKKLVGFMGGIYSDQLTLAVTHLVADKITSICSGKYEKAVHNNIPIVKSDWILKCWELSKMGQKAPEAIGFRLPPFQGMHITCSNLSQVAKKKLHILIEANGGIYLRTLELNKTVVLVIGDPEGKKWQHAQQWEIPCVTPSWIYESVERGVAVPSKDHLVVGRPKCSTPTNSGEHNSFMSCSDISVVPMPADKSRIDETNTSIASTASLKLFRGEERKTPLRPPPDGEYKKLLEEINMLDVKAAGPFLDGCKIYLSGFSPQECEKLKRLINSGGATLFTSLSDNLSHVVVGDFSAADAKELANLIARPHVVKLQWLIQCLKERRSVAVENFLCLQSTPAPPASPLSHKGLQLLKSQSGTEEVTVGAADQNELRASVSRKLFVKAKKVLKTPEKSLTEQNSVDFSALERRAQEELLREKENALKSNRELVDENPNQAAVAKTSDGIRISMEDQSNISEQSTLEPFFQGLTFEILGYDEIEQIKESIEKAGGKVISNYSNEIPDYTIVPVEGADLKPTSKNVVSIIFVEDCYDHDCLIKELEYYHRPLPGLLDTEKKLEGAIFALSGFGRAERRLLVYVASNLGAVVQDMFSRSDHPDKGVKRSTHLLCKEATGKKYEAALKWGIPVETPEWLISQVQRKTKEKSSLDRSLSCSINDVTNRKASVNNLSRHDESVAEPMEYETSDGPNDVTPLNAALKRMSVPGSAGFSPFHVETPNTPYGKIFSENTPSPTTRKRWKKWIDGLPDLYEGSPGSHVPRNRRPSTPIDVIKKQLWSKYGGVKIDGIEQHTGKLLKQGPFSEWAKDSESESESKNNSVVNEKENLNNLNDPDSIFSALQAKITESQLVSQNVIDELKKAESLEELSPHLKQRLSNRISQPQVRQHQSPTRDWDDDNQGGHFNENNVVMWDFSSNGKNPLSDKSTGAEQADETDNNFSSISKAVTTPQPSSASKLLSTEMAKRNAAADCVVNKTPIIKTQKLENCVSVDESTKVFLLSGLSAESKQKYEGIIRHLGGGVTQSATYDPATTHIIIEKPIRSEKLLCCIASGKWVLHTSYLDSCYETRQFLPEEEYEWGNQRSVVRLPKVKEGSTEAGLVAACYKWRKRKQDMGSTSPFREMKVCLVTAENKKPQFTRLLEAGGATIFQQSDILKCNFVIWEEGKIEIPVPLKELASRKVHVVQPVFLGEFLVKATPPSDHYPPSYIAIIKQMRQRCKH